MILIQQIELVVLGSSAELPHYKQRSGEARLKTEAD
jgi:hypothetical protein